MNLKLYSIALLISAIPHLALAGAAMNLTKEDFTAAERVSPDGETVIKVKLSKSGRAKLKKWNLKSVDKEVRVEVAGVTSEFKLRQPIQGDGLEMGPYPPEEAERVVAEVNRK
jgi:hypothetical protein